ncbi:hypothetical protein ScPMuIL_010982 [Solemya velum]
MAINVGVHSLQQAQFDDSTENTENTEKGFEVEGLFSPPLYVQRYSFIHDVLTKYQVKSVVDFGSAECKITSHLKHVKSVERIALVDQDLALIEQRRHSIKPRLHDFVYKRQSSLFIQLFHGNATQLDQRIKDYEAATMVELIEHLFPEDLEGVRNMVFGQFQPRVVVITTPNSEYNVLFTDFSGMRHSDHKFEWTRQEFQNWCNNTALEYDYSVEYSGIGDPPAESQHLGHCSQAAIFLRTSQQQPVTPVEDKLVYKVVAEAVYPQRETIQLSPDALLQLEVEYAIRQFNCDSSYRDEDDNLVIPLNRLHGFPAIKTLCDIDSFSTFLKKCEYKFTNDNKAIVLACEPTSRFKHLDREDSNNKESGQFSDAEDDDTTPNYKDINSVTQSNESWDTELYPT